MKRYDELTYWRKRKNPSSKQMTTQKSQKHLDCVRPHLEGCIKILDFGPGIGRMFPAFKNVSVVEAFDIAAQHRQVLEHKAKGFNFEFNLTVGDVVGQLPYSDGEFDVAVASEVLLHQKSENIIKVMRELVRVAKKVVVITWHQVGIPFGNTSGEHCIHHDYFDICKTNGWSLKHLNRISIKSVCFVIEEA